MYNSDFYPFSLGCVGERAGEGHHPQPVAGVHRAPGRHGHPVGHGLRAAHPPTAGDIVAGGAGEEEAHCRIPRSATRSTTIDK